MGLRPQTDEGCVDALRLDPAKAEQLLAALDGEGQAPDREVRREHERYAYHVAPGVVVKVSQPGGNVSVFRVVPRNLSCGGMSFLHGGFLYTGAACGVRLCRLNNQDFHVSGKVIRCRHVQGRVHEVGVQFDQEIDLCHFIKEAGQHGVEADDFDAPRLDGSVLYLEPCLDDRELMRFFAQRLGVRLTLTEGGLEALSLVQALPFDVALAALDAPDHSGAALPRLLHEHGFAGAVIGLVLAEGTPVGANAAPGCQWVLRKPYRFADLAAVLAQYLRSPSQADAASAAEPLPSLSWYNVRMRPLILEFLGRLEPRVQRLQQASQEGDLTILQFTLQEIKGSAGGYGYPQISDRARELLAALSQASPMAEIQESLQGLVQLCTRACLVHQQMTQAP